MPPVHCCVGTAHAAGGDRPSMTPPCRHARPLSEQRLHLMHRLSGQYVSKPLAQGAPLCATCAPPPAYSLVSSFVLVAAERSIIFFLQLASGKPTLLLKGIGGKEMMMIFGARARLLNPKPQTGNTFSSTRNKTSGGHCLTCFLSL